MKKHHAIFGLKTCFFLLNLFIIVATQAYEVAEGEFFVKFHKGTISSDSVDAIQEELGADFVKKFPRIGAELWKFSDEEADEADEHSTRSKLSKLRSDNRIEYVEPNYLLKIDQTSNTSYDSKQWVPDVIHIKEALEIYQPKEEIIVAVIDTGVDYTHPALLSKIWKNLNEIPGNNFDDDQNGYDDDVYGHDFCQDHKIINEKTEYCETDSDPIDENFHGTHCAGIIAAVRNNEMGIAGVADTPFVKIMALKIQDKQGNGTVAAAISAIEYAIQNGAKIINASWGMDVESKALKEMIEELKPSIGQAQEKGILLIASAGNDSHNNDENPHYPASYNLDNVISVAATNANDELANFSHYGRNSVDLGAPGVNIYSTVPFLEGVECYENQGCYLSQQGTSMATPYVTGVAALLWSARPELTYLEVKNKLLSAVDKMPSLEGKIATGGRLNAFKVLLPDDQPVAICTTSVNGLRATLEAVTLENIASYDWTIHKGETTEQQTGSKIMVDFGNVGNYPVTLVVANNQGLTAQTQCQVEIPDNLPRPGQVTARIKATTTKGAAPLKIHFDGRQSIGQPRNGQIEIDTASGLVKTTPIIKYQWEICTYVSDFDGCFSDNTENQSNFRKTFYTPGAYKITLTVTDELGLTDTTNLEVNVTESWPFLPELGSGMAIGTKSHSVITTAFKGGISLHQEEYYQIEQSEQSLALIEVDVLGEIKVDARHVEQIVDIIAVINMEKAGLWFMLDQDQNRHDWNVEPSTLVALEPQVPLNSSQRVRIIHYKGNLPSDIYQFYFGYRLSNGTLVFNGEKPLKLTIHEPRIVGEGN